MRSPIAYLIVTFLALPVYAGSDFCVQSFNTYGPAYSSGIKNRTKAFVNHLEQQGLCDVLQLQETWRDSHQNLLDQLIQSTFRHTSFIAYDDHREDDSMTGLVTVYKGQPSEFTSIRYYHNQVSFFDWVRQLLGVKKALALVTNSEQSAPVSSVLFFNTHLHHHSTVVRLAQLFELGIVLSDRNVQQHPVVIAGDFNFEPSSLEWKFVTKLLGLKDAYKQIHPNEKPEHCTYCGDNPLSWSKQDRRIDYVFYRDTKAQKLLPTQATIVFKEQNGQPLSDHYGLQVDFQVKNSSKLSLINASVAGPLLSEDLLNAISHKVDRDKKAKQLWERFLEKMDSLKPLRSRLTTSF